MKPQTWGLWLSQLALATALSRDAAVGNRVADRDLRAREWLRG